MEINNISKYKRACLYLFCQIDRALTALNSEDLLKVGNAREILQTAMDEAEAFLAQEEKPPNPEA